MNSEQRTVPSKCLSCHAELSLPYVCQQCHRLYPVSPSTDYFALLGLPAAYDVKPGDVDKRFLAVSRQVHPDYYANASDQVRRLATRLSAELNEAARVLKDPVSRADYLLETCKGPSASQDRTVPGNVLADAMELRESIEQAQSTNDTATLERVATTVESKRGELTEQIAALAGRLPELDDTAKSRLRHLINSVKYYDNMADLLWTSAGSAPAG